MEVAKLLRLDRIGADGTAPIHLRICWLGNKVRLSSGEKVRPSDWDKKNQKVKPKVLFGADINNRLETYSTNIKKFAYHQKGVITEEMVRAEVERIRVEELGLVKKIIAPIIEAPRLSIPFEFVDRYRAEMKADRSESWQNSMEVVGNHLNAFRPGLDWHELTMNNLNLFKVYLQEEEEVSDATLESYIGLLRGMLKYAGRSGMPVPADYTYLEVRRAGETLQPELELNEIDKLIDVKIKYIPDAPYARDWDIESLEQTRWFFVMACHTGLRHSDLWQLLHPRISHIEGYACLEIAQQKTNKRVPVPLSDDIYHMLRNPPDVRSPLVKVYYNSFLKTIGEQADLKRTVVVGTYYKGDLLSEQLPLHKTMSSHMARRSFATMMTAGGMPTKVLQEIMGHTNIASTEKYTKVSNNTVIQQTIEAWHNSRLLSQKRPLQ